ncbi:uncharacterized protein [Epargyreus clarus]|uniref:uncharacterized protein n=1 Tax=Epargyreus clarus TaxID=520877 RepID=UPI003C2C8338
MKPLLRSAVALSLLLLIHAHPDPEELKPKDPVDEAEGSEPQARVERCTTCAGSLKLNIKSPKEALAALQALPGAEVHTQQSFEGCSTDKGCAGLKVKDGKVIERFGNLDAFKAAQASDLANEFSFHTAGSLAAFEGLGANGPFWWMNKDSPFKNAASGAVEKFSKTSTSSFSSGTTGSFGANAALDLAANPFLNGDISKLGFANAGQIDASRPSSTFQASAYESSAFSANKGEVDISKNPFLNGGVSFGAGAAGSQAFGAGAAGSQAFGAGAQGGSGFGTGYTGSSPSPFAVGSNVNIQTAQKNEFDYEQQAQQNIDEAFQSTGNVQAHAGGSLQQTCAGQGYVCVPKAQCNNGVVNTNGAAVLQANTKKQYCNVRTEICCRIEVAIGGNAQGSLGVGSGTFQGAAAQGSGLFNSQGSGAFGQGNVGQSTQGTFGQTNAFGAQGTLGAQGTFGTQGFGTQQTAPTSPGFAGTAVDRQAFDASFASRGQGTVGIASGTTGFGSPGTTGFGTGSVNRGTTLDVSRGTSLNVNKYGATNTNTFGSGFGSTVAPTTPFRPTGQSNFIDSDSFSAGSDTASVYRPGSSGSGLKPGIPYLPPDNTNSGSNVYSSTAFPTPSYPPPSYPSPTFPTFTPRPFTTPKPTYLPPVSSTSAPGYLPPIGEQTINRETRLPPGPNYVEGQLILDENRQPRPRPPTPGPAPSEIPAGCAAALKCTPIEFCTAEGVISNTSVILSREQDAYRVPLTDCRDIATGRIGKCCRDPLYTDPWPTNQLGKWVPGVFGGNDGKYVPDSRGSSNNIRPGVTVRPPVTGSVRLDNFRTNPTPTVTPKPTFPYGPNQVTPGYPVTVAPGVKQPVRGQGQYGIGGQGQYGIGGQGQYGIGSQGQIGVGGQGNQLASGSNFNTAFTPGQRGQGVLVNQGQGTLTSQGQGTLVTQGQGTLTSQGAGVFGSRGQGTLVNQGQGTITTQGQGAFVNRGQGTLVSQGQGTLTSQGAGVFGSRGQGTLVNQGQGTLVTQGQGTLTSQGQGAFVNRGQGTLVNQGQGTLTTQGQGVFGSRGQGTLVSQGQGTLTSQGQGVFGSRGQGTLVTQGQGTLTSQGQGTLVNQGQGTLTSQGQGVFGSRGQGTLVTQGQGQFGVNGQGQIQTGGAGIGVIQGQGQRGQGQIVTTGQGTGISQGFGTAVTQGQGTVGQGVEYGQGSLVTQGQGSLVSQGQGQIVSQGQGQLVSRGQGQIVTQGQGAYGTAGQGQLVSQGGGALVSQGGGALVSQGGGALVSQGGGLVTQGGAYRGQGQFGQGSAVSNGFGFGVTQGEGQAVFQGQGSLINQGFGAGIKQGQGVAVSQGTGFGVENEYGESVQRVFLSRYDGSGQCGLLNGQKPYGNRNDNEVDFAEIPWQAMVLLQTNRSLLCGGVITRPDVVITSAACVDGLEAKNVLIKGGEWKLGIDEEPLPFQIVQVKTILRHPFYKSGSLLYDAAILVLTENLRFAKNIYPICLPRATDTLDAFYNGAGECIVTGWGKQVLQAHLLGSIMHSINVSLINPGECQSKLSQDYPHLLEQYDEDSCACGQPTNPLNNICRVDIGSALACTTGNGQYVMRGVYSWDSGCQTGNQIAAFYKFDLEWYEWAIGLIETTRFTIKGTKVITTNRYTSQFNAGLKEGVKGVKGSISSGLSSGSLSGSRVTGSSVTSGTYSQGATITGGSVTKVSGVKGGKVTGSLTGSGVGTFGSNGQGFDVNAIKGFGEQFGFGQGQNQFSTGQLSKFSGSTFDSGLNYNTQLKAPITNSFSASYTEKKVFQTEPKIITYTTKPEIVTYTTKPEVYTYTTKPEIFTYTTKPKIVTYTTKPKIVTYTTKPQIITYTTKPKIVTFTTKPQIITYETSGSGTNPQYVAPGVTFNPSFADTVGAHTHNAKCKCDVKK